MNSDPTPPDWPRVGVVVLNWHGRRDTLMCLQALAALDYSNWSLTLIDNGCSEFSADELTRLAPRARYVRTGGNLGFAGGCNLGMRDALAERADYVWFLNNDAQPEPSALTELIAVARSDQRIGIIGPKVVLASDPFRLDSIALRINLASGRLYLLGHNEVDRGQYDHLSSPDGVTACAMLVSRAACERLGGFDEDYFAYLEDADACLRARAAGFRIAVAPRARVRHNRPPAASGRQSVSSLYYAARNHLRLMAQHGRGGRTAHSMRSTVVAALNLAFALRGDAPRSARLHAVWRGVRDYRRGVFGIDRSSD